MKTLVLGTGAREHALAWKLSQSADVKAVYLHPGNAGTQAVGLSGLDTGSDHPRDIIPLAKQLGIELIVIGPEIMLARGDATEYRNAGFLVVGPDKSGAELESSKAFAKSFMKKENIPTACYFEATSAEDFHSTWNKKLPVVLKLDGLAAGKGVVVAESVEDIDQFLDSIWKLGTFGPGPHRIIVEDFIQGNELSYIGLCDGETFLPLASSTDYKRIGENQTGPNTGGMGAISPSPYITDSLEATIEAEIIRPILKTMKTEGMRFRGVLYIGLMITPYGAPYVLEFNTRFGDPETQAIMMRLENGFAQALRATALGELRTVPTLKWTQHPAVYVVAAAEGYPSKATAGDTITGWNHAHSPTIQVFFAGVNIVDNHMVTQGGRILGVGSVGPDIASARDAAYQHLNHIKWRGQQIRKDIGL